MDKRTQESSSKGLDKEEIKGIFVKGYLRNTPESELVNYFSKYGSINKVYFGYDFLLIDYTTVAAAKKASAKKAHFFKGRRISVRPKRPRKVFTAPVNNPPIIDESQMFQSIISDLQTISDIDEEINCVVNKLQPNPQESSEKYTLVCNDIRSTIARKFRKVQVCLFGSAFTGLGVITSDIDAYLSNIYDSTKKDEERKLLNCIKSLLMRSGKFTQCFVIPATVSLVKCVHVVTGIWCDLNISNSLGVTNSKLIQYYLNADSKVKIALMLIKYWSKVHNFIKPNQFTSYAVTLLFLFYLQCKYEFPSTVSLYEINKNGCPAQLTVSVNIYSASFADASLLEIIENFFSFCVNFCYKTNVMCPYVGYAMEKSLFESPNNLPEVYDYYKSQVLSKCESPLNVKSLICIQDPIDHQHNVSKAVTVSLATKFIKYCHYAKIICESKTHVLQKLLTEKFPTAYIPKSNNNDNFELTTRKSVVITQNWFQTISNFVKTVLTDFIQLKCEQDENESSESCAVFICSAKIQLWQGRKVAAKNLRESISNLKLIERETEIGKYLLNQYNEIPNDDILRFKISIKEQDENILITGNKLISFKKIFASFSLWFCESLLTWIDMYEVELQSNDD